MSDLCDDNRFELIEKYKKELIKATNIETAPDEMAVLDNILFRFWQMGWLDKLELPSAQTDVARDIATIIENERDMRVIKKNAEIIHCRDCKHEPTLDEDGELEFPTERCPCQCQDFYYSWMPEANWFCGNAERRTGEAD